MIVTYEDAAGKPLHIYVIPSGMTYEMPIVDALDIRTRACRRIIELDDGTRLEENLLQASEGRGSPNSNPPEPPSK